MQLNDLFNKYSQIVTADCPIKAIGEKFTYYYAQELTTHLLARDSMELDITAAFPSICHLMFKKEDPFLKEMDKITDKLKKNIFISTTLTERASVDNQNYLVLLNNYCKMFILGYLYNNWKDIHILEYKKDGVLFTGELKHNESHDAEFNTYVNKHIRFHKTRVPVYLFFNKTSVYILEDDKIQIKGKFKDPGKFIYDIITKLVVNQQIYNFDFLNTIKEIYSPIYKSILQQSKLFDKIKYYYCFGTNNFLDQQGNLQNSIDRLEPSQVLKYFVYPILYLLRQEK